MPAPAKPLPPPGSIGPPYALVQMSLNAPELARLAPGGDAFDHWRQVAQFLGQPGNVGCRAMGDLVLEALGAR